MGITMHDISDQLECDVDAIASAAEALDNLAKYCASSQQQKTLFRNVDEWEKRKQVYLHQRQRHEEEYKKLTILL